MGINYSANIIREGIESQEQGSTTGNTKNYLGEIADRREPVKPDCLRCNTSLKLFIYAVDFERVEKFGDIFLMTLVGRQIKYKLIKTRIRDNKAGIDEWFTRSFYKNFTRGQAVVADSCFLYDLAL